METKSTQVTNNVAKIITGIGFKEFKPTDALLTTLGVTNRRFVKICENRVQMNSHEIITFSKWLSVKVDDLLNLEENAE